jgi:hypothetical protein
MLTCAAVRPLKASMTVDADLRGCASQALLLTLPAAHATRKMVLTLCGRWASLRWASLRWA